MRSLLLLAVSALAAPAGAQFSFLIDQPQSNFTWTGNTSLGLLVGNPNQDFQLAGVIELTLLSGGSPVGAGQILSAVAAVVPDLHGKINNPFPFLPPLATVDVENLVLDMASDPFAVSPAGAFSTSVVLTALSGTMTVTPLGSSPTVADLTGAQSDPAPSSGTLTQAGSLLTLLMPVDSTFDFDDPSSGVSGTLRVVGTAIAHFACPVPSNYCATSPNSAGPGAVMSSSGSTGITANDLVLTASGAPPGMFGLFYSGTSTIQTTFGDGLRCVGGPGLFRLPPTQASAGGVFTRSLDQGALPAGIVIAAGDVRHFQCWYRDPTGGGAGFNLSDGRTVRFCP